VIPVCVHSFVDDFRFITPSPLEGEGWGEGEIEASRRPFTILLCTGTQVP
jgi:N-acetylmuramoyl-L-alanine amidase CwlA